MSAPKTRSTNVPLAEFLAVQTETRRRDCEAIDAMMREASDESAVMSGESIVGYGRYAYARADGSTYDWPMIGFSPRKQDLVLYLTDGFDEYEALLAKLGKHRTSKACLYLKKLADVDTDVLRALIERSVAVMAPRRIR